MNHPSNQSKNMITLDDIVQMKAEKLKEIRASKARIHSVTQDLFHPNENTSGNFGLISNFGSGMAILNGVITGFKIIKRIRRLLRR